MADSTSSGTQKMSKRQQQTLLFGALGAVGLILIIIAIYMYQSSRPILTYKNPALGLAMQYPSDWGKFEDQPGVVVAFLSPKETNLDSFQENVNIIVQDLSADPVSLKKYTDMAIRQMVAVFKQSIKIEESVPTLWLGQPAHKFVYQGADPNTPSLNIKMMHSWCIKNNKAYQFTYAALIGSFDRYLPAAEAILNSVTVK